MIAKNHQPWSLAAEDFYKERTLADQLAFLVRYAVLAPSSHNTQPWRFKVTGDRIEVFADFSRQLSYSDEQGRMLVVACGCAIENIAVAAGAFGLACTVLCNPELARGSQKQIATIACAQASGRPAKAGPQGLVEAIVKRVSYRAQFDAAKQIPGSVLQELRQSITEPHVRLDIVIDSKEREPIAVLTGEAMKRKMAQRSFRWELARWLRTNISRKRDGMPGEGHGMSLGISFLAPFILRFVDVSEVEKGKAIRRVLNFPAVGVISTEEDTALQWLEAGRALERCWLLCVKAGMAASVTAAPIEDREAREKLARYLSERGARFAGSASVAGATSAQEAASARRAGRVFPQIVFGFGYPVKPVSHSPRRDVSEVFV